MAEEKKALFWVFIVIAFFAFRVVSVHWIEPFLKRFDSPGWLDKKTSFNTVQGNIGNIIACFLVLAVVWEAEDFLRYFYSLFGAHYYYDPKKVLWIRGSLTPLALLLILYSLFRISKLKK